MPTFKKSTQHNPFRRSFAAVMALAVLLQMGMVSVTHAACSSKGTERIALGELKSCCSFDSTQPPNFEFAALSQKCCDVEKSEAVFFSFKDSDKDLLSFDDLVASTPFALSADAFVPVALRHVQVHLKIPPSTGQTLLRRDCRLNV